MKTHLPPLKGYSPDGRKFYNANLRRWKRLTRDELAASQNPLARQIAITGEKIPGFCRLLSVAPLRESDLAWAKEQIKDWWGTG